MAGIAYSIEKNDVMSAYIMYNCKMWLKKTQKGDYMTLIYLSVTFPEISVYFKLIEWYMFISWRDLLVKGLIEFILYF